MIRLHRSRDNVEESEKHDVHTSPKSDSRGCVKCHSVDVATWTWQPGRGERGARNPTGDEGPEGGLSQRDTGEMLAMET